MLGDDAPVQFAGRYKVLQGLLEGHLKHGF